MSLPALMALTVMLADSAKPVPYNEEKLPWHGKWGRYTLTVEKTGKEEFALERLRIQDEKGETLREVQDQRIMDVTFPKMDPKAAPYLWVSTTTAGAHCCGTDYLFSRDGGVKNVLIFHGGNDGINKLQDLNGDGRPELIASNDGLAYANDLPYAASPHLPLIIGWNGKAYVDQTRLYPKDARKQAAEYRDALVKVLHARTDTSEMERRMNASGYYGCAAAIGEEKAAETWLVARLPPADRKWLRRSIPTIRQAVRNAGKALEVSQAKLLKPKE